MLVQCVDTNRYANKYVSLISLTARFGGLNLKSKIWIVRQITKSSASSAWYFVSSEMTKVTSDTQGIRALDRLPNPGVGGSIDSGASCGINDFIINTRSAALKGFCMTRSAPAAMAVSICSFRTLAVTAMMGSLTGRHSWSSFFLNWSIASRPSSTGISKSINTMSNICRSKESSASRPWFATVTSQPAFLSCFPRTRWLMMLSSTSNT